MTDISTSGEIPCSHSEAPADNKNVLKDIYEKLGTYPHSMSERGHMKNLIKPEFDTSGTAYYLELQYGAAKKRDPLPVINPYINLTLGHQLGYDGPKRESRVSDTFPFDMVDKFTNFALDAKDTFYSLGDLGKRLESVDEDETFGTLDLMSEQRQDESLRRAIGMITRYTETYLLSEKVGVNYLDTDYTNPNGDVLAREKETIADINVHFVKRLIQITAELEMNRFNFWVEQLAGRKGENPRMGAINFDYKGLRQHVNDKLDIIHDVKPDTSNT
jgi:hypothetical protein